MLKPLRSRLQYGVKKDLLSLKGLAADASPALLRCLFEAGFTSPKCFLRTDASPKLLDILARRRQNHFIGAAEASGSRSAEEMAARNAKRLTRLDQELASRLINAAKRENSRKKGQ